MSDFLLNYFPILLSFFALIYTIKALRNGLRESVYNKQIESIQKLISVAVEFSQIIDYSHPPIVRKKIGEINSEDNIERMIALYLTFDKLLHETRFILPRKVIGLMNNQNYQMFQVIDTIKKSHFEKVRVNYFECLKELEDLIDHKFKISKSYKENNKLY